MIIGAEIATCVKKLVQKRHTRDHIGLEEL